MSRNRALRILGAGNRLVDIMQYFLETCFSNVKSTTLNDDVNGACGW